MIIYFNAVIADIAMNCPYRPIYAAFDTIFLMNAQGSYRHKIFMLFHIEMIPLRNLDHIFVPLIFVYNLWNYSRISVHT